MATTRSFENVFQLTDYTQELLLIPQTWGLINQLGIFGEESVSQHSITVEASQGTLSVIGDKVRGERNNVNKDDTRVLRSFVTAHWPLDDSVKPEDIQGKRAYGSPDMAETEAAVIARKLERIRRSHAATLEAARAYTICNGTPYAPNGTVDTTSYYTAFGVSRKEIDFTFGTATADLIGKTEEGVSHIIDNILTMDAPTDFVCLCSPGFFAKLIAHATVKEAYKYYSSTQEPLRNRLPADINGREFRYGGVLFKEYRGVFNSVPLITANEAFMLPVGAVDSFITYFSPASKFSHINTLGEQAYVFTYRDPKDSEITIQSESNFLNLLRRPQAIVRCYTSN